MDWTAVSLVVSIVGVAVLFLSGWYFSIQEKDRRFQEKGKALEDVKPDDPEAETFIFNELEEEDRIDQYVRLNTLSRKPGIDLRPMMQGLLTVVILIAALYVVVVKADSDQGQKDWAYGALGSLVGYWLKR